jgi:Lrp/AsnC family transcriptional regulator, leucine-responsive regulatory protein
MIQNNIKDIKIITCLREDARQKLMLMSKKTGIPVATIFDRLKAIKNSIIIKNTALIDFSKLGYSTKANIMLKTPKEQRNALAEHLMKHPNVNNMYKINNGYDFLIEVLFKNIKDLETFIETLEEKFELSDHKEYYIINDLKKEAFMTNINLINFN